MNRLFYTVIFLTLPLFIIRGQVAEKDRLIQVTGIVSDEENNPVPGVTIISHKLRRGTISELTGIYNLISIPGDTIWLTALGYKNTRLILPSIIEARIITRDITLLNDTIIINDVIILPWKNYEEFKRDVLAGIKTDPETVNMYDNLANIQASIANTYNYRVSPESGYRMAMQQNGNALYTRGQYPSNNLLNPFAWAKLISGIKHGLLKNQKNDQPSGTMQKKPKKKKKPENEG